MNAFFFLLVAVSAGSAWSACDDDYAYLAKIKAPSAATVERAVKYRNEKLPAFINTHTPGTADLDHSFVASYSALDGELFDKNQRYLFESTPVPEFHVFRHGRGEKLPAVVAQSRLIGESAIPSLPMVVATEETKKIGAFSDAGLARLYDQFAQQGPERQILVDIVKVQDKVEADRTVHFVASTLQQPVGHAQVLVSRSAAEPLHIEAQWKGIAPIPGKKKGELGRLSFFQPDETIAPGTVDGFNPAQAKGLEKLARLQLVQKMLAWANHDAGLDSLSLQVNRQVSVVLERMGMPIKIARKEVVAQELGGKRVEEFLYIFDRPLMRKAEDALSREILRGRFRDMLANTEAERIVLRFPRNEWRALFETGAFGDQAPALLKAVGEPAKPVAGASEVLLSRDLAPVSLNQLARISFEDAVFQPLASRPADLSTAIFSMPSPEALTRVDHLELHVSRAAAAQFLKATEK